MRRLAIQKTVYKVNDFLSWQRNKSLILSPSFQRRPVWNQSAKSFLIDTIVKGLPIPIIFIRERTDLRTLEPQREVVDGQQRLRTIISYIEPNLIQDFNYERDYFCVKKSHNKEIANLNFQELSPDFQRNILNYEFSVHILPTETEDREVLQIFARMNSTGVRLNNQEIRNATYFGEFKEIAYSLSYEQLNRWRDWAIFTENDIARMKEVEMTSELILMMHDGIVGRSQKKINDYYNNGEDNYSDKKNVSNRFRAVMDAIGSTFEERIKNSEFSRKALFFTLFCFYYELLFGINSSLDSKSKMSIPKNISGVLIEASEKISNNKVSEELLKVLRGATGNKDSREIRFYFLLTELKNAKK